MLWHDGRDMSPSRTFTDMKLSETQVMFFYPPHTNQSAWKVGVWLRGLRHHPCDWLFPGSNVVVGRVISFGPWTRPLTPSCSRDYVNLFSQHASAKWVNVMILLSIETRESVLWDPETSYSHPALLPSSPCAWKHLSWIHLPSDWQLF